MRYFQKIFLASVLIFLPAVLVSAHGAENKSPRETLMRQMMGDQTVAAMEQMEEAMMGAGNHEQMETLMDKMFAGNFSLSDQEEMIALMRDSAVGPGAMNMMTRMMLPQMMTGYRYGYGGFGLVFWITAALIWAALISVIAAIWRWIKKN